MHEYIKKNFPRPRIDKKDKTQYGMISLISNKIKIVVIGGGKAAFIKVKGFLEKGFSVTCIALEFSEQVKELSENFDMTLINGSHKDAQLDNFHIVVIAIEDSEAIKEIKKYCDDKNKIYLTCYDYTEGNFVMPIQGDTENVNFSINTKAGNPNASKFLRNRVSDFISGYDDFVEYIAEIRKLKKGENNFKEIMEFVAGEDFYFFFKKGYNNIVLDMFYSTESEGEK